MADRTDRRRGRSPHVDAGRPESGNAVGPTKSVLAALAKHGLLLAQDAAVPSVVGIITGESLRSSWWSHPAAQLIFSVLSTLADHPDVLIAKLLYRKDTLIHRSLWPSVLAVACAHEPWQMRELSPSARSLLRRVGRVPSPVHASGAQIKELAVRLLAHARDVHTESGRHEVVLESWRAWSARVGCDASPSVVQARRVLEHAVTKLGAPAEALPWH
jgi:hypothetical protein